MTAKLARYFEVLVVSMLTLGVILWAVSFMQESAHVDRQPAPSASAPSSPCEYTCRCIVELPELPLQQKPEP